MQQGLCEVEDPALLEVRVQHWAACHLITPGAYPNIRAAENIEPELVGLEAESNEGGDV
jgi:hypothetical protein